LTDRRFEGEDLHYSREPQPEADRRKARGDGQMQPPRYPKGLGGENLKRS